MNIYRLCSRAVNLRHGNAHMQARILLVCIDDIKIGLIYQSFRQFCSLDFSVVITIPTLYHSLVSFLNSGSSALSSRNALKATL